MIDARRPIVLVPVVLGGCVLAVACVAGLFVARAVIGGVFRVDQARWDAEPVRRAAQMWVLEHPNCPNALQLVQEEYLDRTRRVEDPWGQPFVIHCPDEGISVVSAGPNARFGDEDDVE